MKRVNTATWIQVQQMIKFTLSHTEIGKEKIDFSVEVD